MRFAYFSCAEYTFGYFNAHNLLAEEDIDFARVPLDDDSLCFFASRRTHQVVLWVRFDPSRLPARCETVDVIDGRVVVGDSQCSGWWLVDDAVEELLS